MRTGTKIAVAAGLIATALMLLLALGVPANFLAGVLQNRVEAATGYRLRIDGTTSIAVLPRPTVSLQRVRLSGDEHGWPKRLSADRVRLALSFTDLIRGHPRIMELTIANPRVRLPISRKRISRRVASAIAAPPSQTLAGLMIDHIVVRGGTIGFYNREGRLESRIEHVDLDVIVNGSDRHPRVTGSLNWNGQPVHFKLRAQRRLRDPRALAVNVTLQVPGLTTQPLTASAELMARNASLAINALSGRAGHSAFNGWATVDFSAIKPLVRADIDFDRLRIPLAAETDNGLGHNAGGEPWSDRALNFDGLNFLDLEMRLTTAEFAVGELTTAPIVVETRLAGGVLNAKIIRAELYGGHASGTASLDASGPVPAYAMRVNLDGVDALPVLSGLAGFEHLEGKMQTSIDVSGTGASQRAAISSLAGTIDVDLSNGAIRGIDVVKLIHNLTTHILSGWQLDPTDRTDLATCSAQFRIASGVANVVNLDLEGPLVRVSGAGDVDLPAKTLQLKVEPRLTAGSISLPVPVVIEGNWNAPRIYPDVAGILDDPEGAYAQLKAVGKSLFGEATDTAGKEQRPLDSLIEGLERMFIAPDTQTPPLPGNAQ